MRRREFITLIGVAAAAWPLAARAQQSAMPVIGILAVASPEANEGRNVNIEYRWAEAYTGRLPELAARFVEEQVAVLVTAGGTSAAVVAHAATPGMLIVLRAADGP